MQAYHLSADMSVNQISETLGYKQGVTGALLVWKYEESVTGALLAWKYESPENFIRAFKKIYQMTPAKYRQMNRPDKADGREDQQDI